MNNNLKYKIIWRSCNAQVYTSYIVFLIFYVCEGKPIVFRLKLIERNFDRFLYTTGALKKQVKNYYIRSRQKNNKQKQRNGLKGKANLAFGDEKEFVL